MSALRTSQVKPQRELTLEELLHKVGEYLPPEKQEVVARAFAYALTCHEGQFRKSGESFVQHPIHTAYLVADLRLDANTLAAALLHDVPEDCGISFDELERRFGSEVCKLVDGVTKLGRIEWQETGATTTRRRTYRTVSHAENLRKMFMAMAEDVRVVIIKLADRLHNMRTLQAHPPQKRRTIAQETLEIYAPLANRLGIWQFKWELEDLSFRFMEPERYRETARLLATTRATREEYIQQVCTLLLEELDKVGIKAEVFGRPKHLYSIHQKMQKYAAQGRDAGQIYDLLALRVLVNTLPDCYSALGVAHNLWHPLPGTFDDYISMPKESGYQSLHTTVMCEGAQPVEVQIRTHDMHRIAEYGVAAHWRYKEGSGGKDLELEAKLSWLRQLLEWQRDLQGAEEFVESVKTDLFNDQVFIFTPKGEIKVLPAGATPLDFAYRIHTELGHRCIGAKSNGRLIPLNQPLKTGDVVEIITGKGDRGPRLDWLNFNLGYLKTSHAREKVRQWFRRQERAKNIEQGRELLKREIARLGLSMTEEAVAQLFKYENLEEFLAALGYGDVNVGAIAVKLAAHQERPIPIAPPLPPPSPSKGIRVLGVGDLLTRLASCCHPVPGDEILGYITRTRGVSVHRKNCPNIRNEDEKERLIPVEWGAGSNLYSVPVRITALDRVGLLRDIAAIVSSEAVNILQTYQSAQPDGTAQFLLTLETTGMSQLSRILAKIEGISGVTSVARAADSKPA